MIVDVHAHALDEAFLFDLSRKPAFGLATEPDGQGGYILTTGGVRYGRVDPLVHDLQTRVESLEARRVDTQLISPLLNVVSWAGGAAGAELCRLVNKQTAALVSQGEGRLGGMVSPPLGEPEQAADEIRRAVDTYGFRGATIGTSAGGRPLDDPAYEPMWETLERLGLLVFMHPMPVPGFERFGQWRLAALVAFPFETTLAVTRLIFSGVLERHPGLRLVLCHGGGNLAFLRGRLDTAYFATGWEAEPACREHITRPPSAFYRQLYYDSVVGSPESLRFLVDLVGADRVLFGTDYPFEIGDPDGCHAMPAIRSLPPEAQEQIMGRNAAEILATAGR
jgi:aminocarboxymuconate-semialdehyde decarboxylase